MLITIYYLDNVNPKFNEDATELVSSGFILQQNGPSAHALLVLHKVD